MQREIIKDGEAEDKKSAREELAESNRNRQRRNRRASNPNLTFVPMGPGENGNKNRDVCSGIDTNKCRKEGENAISDEDIDTLYDYSGKIFDFFAKEFRRDSIDGKGMPLKVRAHYRTNPAMKLANAFWDLSEKELRVGEGDSMRKSYALDLSVVAHEYTHGIIQFSGGLKSTKQAGALNESIADVFACMIVQYYNWQNGTFSNQHQTVDKASWKIGEFLFKTNHLFYQQGMAVRSLKAPGTAYNHRVLKKDMQPNHVNGYVENKGPWHNCSIPSHAFYQLAIALGGFAWEKAGKIWYDALMANDDPAIDFKGWVKLTEKIARKYDAKSEMKDAWKKVGL